MQRKRGESESGEREGSSRRERGERGERGGVGERERGERRAGGVSKRETKSKREIQRGDDSECDSRHQAFRPGPRERCNRSSRYQRCASGP